MNDRKMFRVSTDAGNKTFHRIGKALTDLRLARSVPRLGLLVFRFGLGKEKNRCHR